MRVCNTCGETKPVGDFYARPRTKCKECHKEAVRARRQRSPDRARSYDRARSVLPHRVEARKTYQGTPAFRASHNRATRRWQAKNPEKRAAHIAVGNAVRDGLLQRRPCSECGSSPAQAHHDDYSKPLVVRWLCKPCHDTEHARSL